MKPTIKITNFFAEFSMHIISSLILSPLHSPLNTSSHTQCNPVFSRLKGYTLGTGDSDRRAKKTPSPIRSGNSRTNERCICDGDHIPTAVPSVGAASDSICYLLPPSLGHQHQGVPKDISSNDVPNVIGEDKAAEEFEGTVPEISDCVETCFCLCLQFTFLRE